MTVRLIDVHPGEGRLVVPAVAFAFLCIGAQTLAFIASDTLFVTSFSLGALSRFYLVSAVLRVVASLGWGALSSRWSGARSDVAFLSVTSATMLLSWPLVETGQHAAIYAVCVMLVLLPSLLPLVAVSAALDLFHARQAKRLLPLLAASSTAGAIVVGGAAKFLAPRFGTPSLLLVGGLLCAAAAPLPVIIARSGAARAPAKAASGGMLSTLAASLGDVRDLPAIRVFAINAVLASAMMGFVDFAFKATLKARYGRDEMAAFLGTFNVVSEAAVLFVQLFLTSRIVGRLGVRAAIQARPALVLQFGALLALVPGVWAASSAKFVELLLRLSVGGTVSDLLIMPAPAAVRGRAKLLAKAAALPLGSLAAGALLSVFGAAGPSPLVTAMLVMGSAAIAFALLGGAGRAYTALLAQALGRGGATLDASPAEAALLRRELSRMLADSAAAGDIARTEVVLSTAGTELLALDDLGPALRVPGAIATAATRAACRIARPGEGTKLLELLPPNDDPSIECEILACARERGATVERPRIERALALTERSAATDAEAARLWAAALVALASQEKDAAVKRLRKAAIGADSPRRASALAALGDLREKRAEREILRALASKDSSVFAAAARAAVLIDAQGAVPTLLADLEAGPRVRAAARALSLAGASAVDTIIAALPTTRAGGDLHEAVAGSGAVTGTVRAARVLARLGPAACDRVLASFDSLGFRARNAVARSLSASPERGERAPNPQHVERAMESTLAYAEVLRDAHAFASAGLLRGEIVHRIAETADRMLDLASAIGDRPLIARARAATRGDARTRGNAFELLENVLPRALGARTVSLLEWTGDEARPARGELPSLDGWLEKCRLFDDGALASDDAMRPVLDKLLALRQASLFAGLSGEELYPVAQIAEPIARAAGEIVMRQGEPGDALFVLVSGSVAVSRDGARLRELGRGAVFGEMALLDGAPRSATIEAVTDAELYRIPREEFEALLDESPELSRGVIRTLLGHLRGST